MLHSQWLADCCVLTGDKTHKTKSSVFYNSYKKWSEAKGEDCLSQTGFSLRLEALGVKKSKIHHPRMFVGITLQQVDTEELMTQFRQSTPPWA